MSDTRAPETALTREELQLATRNHGMPLEAMRTAITPPGLHYLLIHYDIPDIDPAAWALELSGRVERPLSLSLAGLAARRSVEVAVTMECAGNGRARLEPRPISQPWLNEAVGTARWRGVPLRDLLEEAAPLADAVEVVFGGVDRGIENGVEQSYERSLTLAEALEGEALIATEMNGAPIPPQHGYPARLVVPGWYGMTNVKWLARISVVEAPFEGYQQSWAYRLRRDADDPGVPVSRMLPRSLLVPPGVPDFMTRDRTVTARGCRIEGRAWSGRAPIAGVEWSDDGGESWRDAELEPDALGAWAWRGWRAEWQPGGPGAYRLGSRARDAAGNVQPLEPVWNLGGYANNAVQWVDVTVSAQP